MKSHSFKIVCKNKKLMKHGLIRKWIMQTEEYLNFKLEREIEGLLHNEVKDRVREMMGR